jgi:type 1 glutamine amidotransferase
MIKKPWLIALSLVVLLGATFFVVASCNLIHTSTPTTSRVKCNGQQANLDRSGTPITNDSCSSRLLVFSKTGGFRHTSIKDGKIALQRLATEHNFVVDFTEDASIFTDANLVRYDAVIFLMTTGNIFDDNQKAAFERYIRAGGGYVGVHSASDTEYAWSWYGGLVGAYFDRIHGHSKVMQATIHVTDRTHPSTMMLPTIWIRTDEWYNFATNPRGRVNILMTIDERIYKGGTMGVDHPIAWYHEYDGGRAWYTAMGHTSESYYEPLFLAHLWGGIMYAAGGRQSVMATSQVIGVQDIEVFIHNMPLERKIQTVLNFPQS